MATITLRIHLEPAGDIDAGFVWWAESDQVPGFTAAADHLPELIDRARAALIEIEGPDVEILPQMEFDDAEVESRTDSVSAPTAPAVGTRQKTEARQEIDTLTAA
jgi:hypothetical protein